MLLEQYALFGIVPCVPPVAEHASLFVQSVVVSQHVVPPSLNPAGESVLLVSVILFSLLSSPQQFVAVSPPMLHLSVPAIASHAAWLASPPFHVPELQYALFGIAGADIPMLNVHASSYVHEFEVEQQVSIPSLYPVGTSVVPVSTILYSEPSSPQQEASFPPNDQYPPLVMQSQALWLVSPSVVYVPELQYPLPEPVAPLHWLSVPWQQLFVDADGIQQFVAPFPQFPCVPVTRHSQAGALLSPSPDTSLPDLSHPPPPLQYP